MLISKNLKKTLEEALDRNDFDALLHMDIPRRQLMTALMRFAYDKETLAGWRAIRAVGVMARTIIGTDSSLLRETCRKLLWSMNDESGGIGWSAPELLGEIATADPRRFADFIPIIANAHDVEEHLFRPGVLYALGRIAEVAPGMVLEFRNVIAEALVDKDARTRIFALHLLGLVWQEAVRTSAWSRQDADALREQAERMTSDLGEAWIYRGNGFQNILVKEEAGVVFKSLIK